MSNLPNFQEHLATNASSESDSDDSESGRRLHNSKSNQLQRNTTPIPTKPSSERCSMTSGEYFIPRQPNLYFQMPQYVISRLSTDSSTDGGYSTRNSAISSSSVSSVFSADNRNYQLQPLRIKRGDGQSSDSSSSDNGNYRKHLSNHRTSSFNRNPVGMTSTTHFFDSQYFKSPPASALPQPPQSLLFGKTEALVPEEKLNSQYFQSPPASASPQPPQSLLFGKTEALVPEEKLNSQYFQSPPASALPQPPQSLLFGKTEAPVQEGEFVSQYPKSPPASALPQPPQSWLLGRTKALVPEKKLHNQYIKAPPASALPQPPQSWLFGRSGST